MQSKSCGCEKKQSAKVTQIVKGARTKKKKKKLFKNYGKNRHVMKI